MTSKENTKILDLIAYQNKNFSYDNKMLSAWYEVLKDYDFSDVAQVVAECLSEDKFQYQPPTAYYLVKNLKKVTEKTNINSYQVYCPICGRLFETYTKQLEHFDRCSSVDYVIIEFKKCYPNDKQPNKKELYEMSESEFKIRYLKLLNHIYKNTTSEKEKEILKNVLGIKE